MKRIVASLVFIAAFATALQAQGNPLITYAEGKAQVQDTLGKRRVAETGSLVVIDETLITGKGGRIQLKTKDGIFEIMENTVLKLMQAQKQGKKQNAYICALGRVNMKVNKLASGDPGPRLGSSTAAAGVRGTELDIYAGADGSSLVVVTEGIVDVESQGATVGLNANEGVEVKPGQAPGAKFGFRQPIDYSEWNQAKIAEFEKDPILALTEIDKQVNEYVKTISGLWDEYKILWQEFEKEDQKRHQIEKDEGAAAGEKYYTAIVQPITNKFFLAFTDIRFNALSALSMRRYVLGRLYLFMEMQFINSTEDKTYQRFMTIYKTIVDKFNAELFSEESFGSVYPQKTRFIEEGNI